MTDYGEPWGYGYKYTIVDEHGRIVASTYINDFPDPVENGDLMRRIVACVNACQGVPFEQLTPGLVQQLLGKDRLPENQQDVV